MIQSAMNMISSNMNMISRGNKCTCAMKNANNNTL